MRSVQRVHAVTQLVSLWTLALVLLCLALLGLPRSGDAATLCEEDLTSQVTITRTFPPPGLLDRFLQILEVRNPGNTAIAGPLVLALDNLPSGVTVLLASGSTHCAGPLGSPMLNLFLLPNQPLGPHQSTPVILLFNNPHSLPVTYHARLLRLVPSTISQLLPPSLPLAVGSTGTLTATITPAPGTPTTLAVSSDQPSLATVPTSIPIPVGATQVTIPVTAKAAGTAVITANLNGTHAHSTVTVTPPAPTVSTLAPDPLQITVGASGTLTVSLNAVLANDAVVTLSVSNPAIATAPSSVTVPAGHLAQTFTITGLAPGTALITASLNESSAQSHLSVILAPPTVVSLLPPTLPLTTGSTGTLTVSLNAAQPSDTIVFITTSDGTIAGLVSDRVTVPAYAPSGDFPVTALRPGLAMVTASLDGNSLTAAVNVTPPAPQVSALACPPSIAFDATGRCTITLNAAQLTDTIVPLTAAPSGIVEIAGSLTVPGGSLTAQVAITGLAAGTASVTAGLLNGTSQSATIQVLPPAPTIVSLLPPTLGVYIGATGTLILTLNAAQLTDTVILVTATPTGILTIPDKVTVPAGALTVPVTVRGLATGSVTLSACLSAPR